MDYTVVDILFVAGRILFGGFFLMSGVKHFMHTDMLAGYAASKGVPFPKAAVLASGLFIVLGGLGVLSGVYPQISVTLIAIFLVLVSVKMHAYWKIEDPNMKMGDRINFEKNMALLGAALMLLSVSVIQIEGGPSVWTLPLF